MTTEQLVEQRASDIRAVRLLWDNIMPGDERLSGKQIDALLEFHQVGDILVAIRKAAAKAETLKDGMDFAYKCNYIWAVANQRRRDRAKRAA